MLLLSARTFNSRRLTDENPVCGLYDCSYFRIVNGSQVEQKPVIPHPSEYWRIGHAEFPGHV